MAGMTRDEMERINRLLNGAPSERQKVPNKSRPAKPTSEILDRQPPSNLQAEQAVLGCCLLDDSNLSGVLELLSPSDFYAERHAMIFGRMAVMFQGGNSVDSVLLTQSLRESGELGPIGGTAYLAELLQSVAVASHAVHYAGIVAGLARRRKLILGCLEAVRDAYSEQGLGQEVIDRLSNAVAGLSPPSRKMFDHDLEARLLSGLAVSDGARSTALALDAGDFHHETHRLVFRAMRDLAVGKAPMDCPAAVASLAETRWKGGLEEADVAAIFARRPGVVREHAQVIRKLRIEREKDAAAAKIRDAVGTEPEEWLRLVAKIARDFRALISRPPL